MLSANPKERHAKILKITGISVAQAVELNTNKKYEPTCKQIKKKQVKIVQLTKLIVCLIL